MKALIRIACLPLVIVGQLYILLIFAGACLYATYRWARSPLYNKKD